jgi:LmbE family N-acetylglucosaminyl deacetylase
MNPYAQFIDDLLKLLAQAQAAPLGVFPPPKHPVPRPGAPRALIFSPHPDDEVIIGALPLRLLRQSGWNVFNVAVTQGSNKARQAERWQELTACCRHIGFGLVQTAEGGLENIRPATRQASPAAWAVSVARIGAILAEHQPRVVFLPHAADWNSAHIGTHWLVVDAMTQLGPAFRCHAVETEFWGAMAAPNLMVESSPQDVAELVAALSFHVGEVRRNPYHVRLPAWMLDNVRRGSEVVGGQGAAAPDFQFATLYRLQLWKDGAFQPVLDKGRLLPCAESPESLFRD